MCVCVGGGGGGGRDMNALKYGLLNKRLPRGLNFQSLCGVKLDAHMLGGLP